MAGDRNNFKWIFVMRLVQRNGSHGFTSTQSAYYSAFPPWPLRCLLRQVREGQLVHVRTSSTGCVGESNGLFPW
ncbi:hypothetical protein EYF80_006956 [Liparis tanakae]|uniref:Uncharacterized protein n=1 Tax=Liparis tanakae TaxID=230148 RepID=A0A4Z2IXK8_9TELE|nr:hypothetical protein EYF80_006956 [Liparis tanakae]